MKIGIMTDGGFGCFQEQDLGILTDGAFSVYFVIRSILICEITLAVGKRIKIKL